MGAPLLLAVAVAAVAMLALLALAAWAWYHSRTRIHLAGRSVVVAGAARGMGREVALQLCDKGVAHLLLLDVLPLDDVRAEIERGHPAVAVRCVQCDVANADQVQMAVSKAQSPVCVVINCAGIVSGRSFAEMDEDTFARTVSVNLHGSFLLLKAFLPEMRQHNDGIVVLVSSLMGLMGGARLTDYCASKFALVGLAEALRLELAGTNVAVAVVCPYVVDTGMFRGAFEASWRTRLVKRILPFLSPASAASGLIATAERGLSVTTTLPFFFGPLINIVRCLPTPIYELALTIMGGAEGMDSFLGREASDRAEKKKS